jgi:hypothetical protein
MWNVLAFIAFVIAAIFALVGIPGIGLTVIVGVIAIGLALLALGASPLPAIDWSRRVGP